MNKDKDNTTKTKTKTKLRRGDILYRPKGIIEHAGVYIGDELVAHNAPNNDAEIISLEKFKDGHNVRIVHQNLSEKEQNLLFDKVEKKISQRKLYNVITNNCEHFATEIVSSNQHSAQLQIVILGLFTGCIMSKIFKSENTIKNTILGGGIFLMLTNINRKYDAF